MNELNIKVEINNVYIPLYENANRYLILYGGAGSGKSVFAAQKLILRLISEKRHRFLVVRKVGTTLKESVWQLLNETIDGLGLRHLFSFNKTTFSITNRYSGNSIICTGLDDPEKLKSITGITGIWVEEGTELNETDFDQLDLRLRGETENYKQIIVSFNPIDEKHWLKKKFYDTINPNTTLVKTTFEDNFFIDEDYKKVLESKAASNPNYYRIYRLGEWGVTEVQRPYCYNFERSKHVSERAQRIKGKPIYISIDFNVDPFVCILMHLDTSKAYSEFHIFEEIIIKGNGDVWKMCEKLKLYLGNDLSNIYITGDAMQRKKEITQRDNIDAWRIIQKELKVSTTRMQVPKSNPNVANNRHLVNTILCFHPNLYINPKCKLLINELETTEADTDGSIIKKNRRKEEQRSDGLDCFRYACNTWLFGYIDATKK